MPTIFVTGTDTGVGKTRISCGLLKQLREEGSTVCGYKPVASGCEKTPEGLRNEDALALQEAAQTTEDYGCINPYAFVPAIAPHLAAKAVGVNLNLTLLNQAHDELALSYDWVVTEGAGMTKSHLVIGRCRDAGLYCWLLGCVWAVSTTRYFQRKQLHVAASCLAGWQTLCRLTCRS